MRTVRPSLVGTVILMLLGGVSGAVVAQTESDAPGSGDSVALSFTAYHGLRSVSGPTIGREEGRTTYRDHLIVGAINSGDPRLHGKSWVTYNTDVFDDSGLSVFSGVAVIDNEDGSWRGTVRGQGIIEAEEDEDYLLWDLTGEGAYEGLSARMFWVPFGGAFAAEGIIFEGELPPMPDPVEPTSE